MLDAKGVMQPYQEPRSYRGWLLGMLVLIVFAAFGGVVAYAWLEGLPGSGGGEPPLIRAEAEPYRRAPNDRGGLPVANVSSSIVSVLRPKSEPPRVERLLPPETPMALETADPEVPAEDVADEAVDEEVSLPPNPVLTEDAKTPAPPAEPQDGRSQLAVLTPDPVPAPPPAAAAPAPTAPIPVPRPGQPASAPPGDIGGLIAALPPPAAPAPAPPSNVRRPGASEPSARTAAASPEPPARPAPPARAAAPPPPPRTAASARSEPPARATPPDRPTPPARVAALPPRLNSPEPSTPPARQPPSDGASSAGAGIYRLQLTAVRSETGLTQAWTQLRQRYPILGGVSPAVERTDTSSGPLFRLQAGPFQSREAAANACSAIRSGGGQCFIVGPMAQ